MTRFNSELVIADDTIQIRSYISTATAAPPNDMQKKRIARRQVDRYTAHNLRLIEDPLEATVKDRGYSPREGGATNQIL